MQDQLRQIYKDVFSRSLSRQEALEKIKTLIKGRSRVLLATPVWQASAIETHDVTFAARHLVALQNARHEDYADHALACFERVRTILRSKPQGKVLVQVVVSDEVLAGLSALL